MALAINPDIKETMICKNPRAREKFESGIAIRFARNAIIDILPKYIDVIGKVPI